MTVKKWLAENEIAVLADQPTNLPADYYSYKFEFEDSCEVRRCHPPLLTAV